MTTKNVNDEIQIEHTADFEKAADALVEYAVTLPLSDRERHTLYKFIESAISEAERSVLHGFLAHMETLIGEGEVTGCQEETQTT